MERFFKLGLRITGILTIGLAFFLIRYNGGGITDYVYSMIKSFEIEIFVYSGFVMLIGLILYAMMLFVGIMCMIVKAPRLCIILNVMILICTIVYVGVSFNGNWRDLIFYLSPIILAVLQVIFLIKVRKAQ